MGLPSKKRTKTSKRQRASHFALKATSLSKCSQCDKPVLPYHACEFCGYYKGKSVIKMKPKRKTQKQKAQDRKQEAKDKAAKKTK